MKVLEWIKDLFITSNYSEEIKDSDGRIWFVNMIEQRGRWLAEGYRLLPGRWKRVAPPLIACGCDEATAYDNLLLSMDRIPVRARSNRKRG